MSDNIVKCEIETIAEKVVNSVLESDQEITPTNSRRSSKSSHAFTDGLSFLNAIKSLQKNISPVKDTLTENVQTWQIWYWRRSGKHAPRNANWQEFLHKKSSFTTKDEFWSVSDEINGVNIEFLSDHFDCYIFRQGIKPMWEDPNNKEGGRWIIQINREHCWKHLVNLEEMWLKVVLLITGNGDTAPDYFDEICGCALMVRHETIKIAVWTRDANNTLANLAICRFLKMHTGFAGIMWYERHSPSDTRHTKTKIRFNLPNQASH